MIRVLVNGARGKMGTMAVETISADSSFDLVGKTDRNDDLIDAINTSKAQVVVDFTNAAVGYENFLKIIEAGAHPVVGTSGFIESHVNALSLICATKGIGALIAPNFSIGALLMMKFAKEAAQYMTTVEIIEAHHEQKLDSPSGTAIRTAEMISEALHKQTTYSGAELIPGVRGGLVKNIHIHSLRLPGVLAQQRVMFGAEGQTLSIEHNSINRDSFRTGIVLAVKSIIDTTELFYGLETLIFTPKRSVQFLESNSPD